MAAAAAKLGHGTILKKESTAGNYTAIPEVYDLQIYSADRNMIDVTHQTSPDYAREFMAGLTDWGELSCDIGWTYANAMVIAIQAELYSVDFSTLQQWQVEISATGSVFNFIGFVKSFTPKAAIGDILRASLVVKITGKPGTLATV
jgi:hypothetical protein